MAQVNVSIGGRPFRIACEDGQEPHLESLARTIDERIAEMRRSFGEIGDQRLTVMAAISILDEASERQARMAALERRVAELESARAETESQGESWATSLAETLDACSERIERLAKEIGK